MIVIDNIEIVVELKMELITQLGLIVVLDLIFDNMENRFRKI
jgi:hypothetical protein